MDFKLTRTQRIVLISLAILGFIIFSYQGEIKDRKAFESFKQFSVHGIVSDKNIFQYSSGFPSYLINGEWVHFGITGEKVENFIFLNDSLSKSSGTDTIRVYRKNEFNEWILVRAR